MLARRLSVAFVALLAVASAPAAHAQSQTGTAPRSITVVGDVTLTAPNDTATVSFQVQSRGRTPAMALDASSATARRVVAAIEAAGVAKDDIQTEELSLRHPVVGRRGHRHRAYVAVNRVRATVRDVSKTGAVIAAAVGAGATSFSGVEFSSSNADALYRQALAQAYDQARTKASTLAVRAGVTLGGPIAIVEGQASTEGFSQPPAAVQPVSGRTPAPPPVEPGTSSVEATVTVTFAIS